MVGKLHIPLTALSTRYEIAETPPHSIPLPGETGTPAGNF
jgi:hypothetical protein